MLWYLYRNWRKATSQQSWDIVTLFYNWNNLSDVVDVQETIRYDTRKKEADMSEIILKCKVYWKERKISLLTLDWEDEDKYNLKRDNSHNFYEKILDLTKDWLITDETRWVWQEVLKFVKVSSITAQGVELYVFKQIDIEQVSSDDNRFERKYKDPKDIGTVVLAKEQMLWYTNPNKIKVRDYDKEMDLSATYSLQDPRNPGNKLDFLHNFSRWLRDALFSNVLEDWNANPQHYNHKRTTLLQAWQIDLIKRMWRRTVFICPRQMWKSMFLALMVILELLSYNYYQSSKARQIIYLSYSVNAFDFVSWYIQKLMANIPRLSDCIVCSDNTIRFIDTSSSWWTSWWWKSKWKIKIISECRFFTSLWRAPATWYSWDTIIIDEAMLISEKIWKGIEPIARGNGSKVLIATAYYPEIYQDKMTYDRPIKLCLEREKESRQITDIDTHILDQYDRRQKWEPFQITRAWLRYTVDDSEVTIDKEWWKKSLEDNQEEYMKQLYSVAPEKHQLFTYRDKMIQPHNSWYDSIVIAYDPAKTNDISAVLVLWLSRFRWTIEICDEIQLNKSDRSSYFPQASILKTIIQKWQNKTKRWKLYAVIDNSHDWVIDAIESTWIRFFKSYRWTWWTEARQWSRANQINLPKHLMVEASLFLFENWVVKIFENCKTLQNQLDHYFQYENKYTKQNKYQWEWEHDDFVSAMLMWLYTYYDSFWLKFSIEELKKWKWQWSAIPDWVDIDDYNNQKKKRNAWNNLNNLYNLANWEQKQILYSERY